VSKVSQILFLDLYMYGNRSPCSQYTHKFQSQEINSSITVNLQLIYCFSSSQYPSVKYNFARKTGKYRTNGLYLPVIYHSCKLYFFL